MKSIYVITSGKGGAGKSTVTAGLGSALSRLGHENLSKKIKSREFPNKTREFNILLIDSDAGLQSLDVMLGIENDIVYNLSDVFEGKCEPIKAVYPTRFWDNLFLVPAPSSLEKMCTPADMKRLCRGFARYFDLVLIDCPAGVGEGFECAVGAADQALIVSTPDMVCSRTAHIVSNLLEEREIPSRLIINRLDPDIVLHGEGADVDDIIDTVGVQLLGIIPEDHQLSATLANGKILPEDSKSALCFENIARRILGETVPLAPLERL